MSNPLAKAIGRFLVDVAWEAGREAMKPRAKATLPAAKAAPLAAQLLKELNATAEAKQPLHKSQFRPTAVKPAYADELHAMAFLSAKQDIRPGALSHGESAFLHAWREQEKMPSLPWGQLAGYADPIHPIHPIHPNTAAWTSHPGYEMLKGGVMSGMGTLLLLNTLSQPLPSGTPAAIFSFSILGAFVWTGVQEIRGIQWVSWGPSNAQIRTSGPASSLPSGPHLAANTPMTRELSEEEIAAIERLVEPLVALQQQHLRRGNYRFGSPSHAADLCAKWRKQEMTGRAARADWTQVGAQSEVEQAFLTALQPSGAHRGFIALRDESVKEAAEWGKAAAGKPTYKHAAAVTAAHATSEAKQRSTPAAAADAMGGSKLKWLLVGSIFRAPVVGAIRYAGTKMVAAKFFGSHLLGAALVAVCALAELDYAYFDPPDPNAPRPSVPLEPTPLPRVQLMREKHVPLPSTWTSHKGKSDDQLSAVAGNDMRCRRVDAGEQARLAIEHAMHTTAHAACVGKDGTGKTRRAKVISVERVENLSLWKQVCPTSARVCVCLSVLVHACVCAVQR